MSAATTRTDHCAPAPDEGDRGVVVPGRRDVSLHKIGEGRWKATNARGGVLPIGSGADPDFSPVELLLAALAGCSAIDVDLITGKRVGAEHFTVEATGVKVADEQGHHLEGLRLVFDVSFPDGEAGDHARMLLPRGVAASRDRLCTVSRTVQRGTPVTYELQPDAQPAAQAGEDR